MGSSWPKMSDVRDQPIVRLGARRLENRLEGSICECGKFVMSSLFFCYRRCFIFVFCSESYVWSGPIFCPLARPNYQHRLVLARHIGVTKPRGWSHNPQFSRIGVCRSCAHGVAILNFQVQTCGNHGHGPQSSILGLPQRST